MFKKNDVLIILLALAIAGGFFAFNALSSHGDVKTVQISVNGQVYKTIQMSEPGQVKIDIKGKINIIQIDEHGARMIEANCPDHLCVNQGEITKKNQTIVCLPNKVVVELLEESDSEFDAISQ